MAPRTEPVPRGDNRNSHGVRNRRYPDAHTGAGVSANRFSVTRGRGSSRNGGNHWQSAHQRRGPVSTLGRRLVERLQSHDDRHHSSQIQDDGDSDTRIQAQNAHLEQYIPMSDTASERHPDFSTRNTVTPTIANLNAYNTQRSTVSSISNSTHISPELRPQQRPISPSPDSPRGRPTRFFDNTNLSYYIAPPPHRVPTKPGQGDDAAARKAFTNPKLRAIMAGKKYPAQRRKAAAEKPVLKMGMRKEYK